MQKEFFLFPILINFFSNFTFSQKNGQVCMNKKDNFSDHKLLDTKGIMKKYSTLIAFLSNFNFCQKWVWPYIAEKS